VAIKKQEFYEGAALHVIARAGSVTSIRYDAPFFVFNDSVSVLLKYTTKNRSPWGFTFMPDEKRALQQSASGLRTVIALVCGSDGVAAISYEAFAEIAGEKGTAIHIACRRRLGEHYEVSGPDGSLSRKIAPSSWQRILTD